MDIKKASLVAVVAFAALYYIGRIGIFYAGTTGSMEFEEPQSAAVEAFVVYSFLGIGVFGILTLPGLYLLKPWGFFGTIAVSAYTIAFDVWAFLAIQSSAAAGIVPAGAIVAYVLLRRKDFLGQR